MYVSVCACVCMFGLLVNNCVQYMCWLKDQSASTAVVCHLLLFVAFVIVTE